MRHRKVERRRAYELSSPEKGGPIRERGRI